MKRAPVSMTFENKPQVSEIVYGKSNAKIVQPKFKVSDFVLINKTNAHLIKGCLPNWTHKLIQILAVVKLSGSGLRLNDGTDIKL